MWMRQLQLIQSGIFLLPGVALAVTPEVEAVALVAHFKVRLFLPLANYWTLLLEPAVLLAVIMVAILKSKTRRAH
jgi:hypothetical protein